MQKATGYQRNQHKSRYNTICAHMVDADAWVGYNAVKCMWNKNLWQYSQFYCFVKINLRIYVFSALFIR